MLIEAVAKPLTYRWPAGEVRLLPGQPINLPAERARKLLARAGSKVRVVTPPSSPWPPECLESEEKFGTTEARLYPLLNRTVWTMKGTGRLVQVFAGRVAVLLDGSFSRIEFLDPGAVRPLSSEYEGG
jgi:hypothetical protein